MDVSFFWREKLAPDHLREHAVAFKNVDPDQHWKPSDTFDDPQPAPRALAKLLAWIVPHRGGCAGFQRAGRLTTSAA